MLYLLLYTFWQIEQQDGEFLLDVRKMNHKYIVVERKDDYEKNQNSYN